MQSPTNNRIPEEPIEESSSLLDLLPENTKKARKQICHSCADYRKLLRTCSICGCVIDLKVLIAKSKCPKGKW
jgi:hypothetical protein